MKVYTNKIRFPKTKNYLIDWWNVVNVSNDSDNKRIKNNINQLILFLLEQMPFKEKWHEPGNGHKFLIPNYREINIYSKNYIKLKNHVRIVNYMSDLFDLQFFFHMQEFDGNHQQGILDFMRKFDLHPYKFEMLKKKYYRKRTSHFS